ncbi:hypothetical protein Pmani_012972 [Petrolisthes manimaculis]|uniref:Uncharacterized protein n=1 Tax=Petrolisthes manimaculis TaxID=1843537 RepID=A0AAE1UE32_9EUCA|nr:hypothetical protein Pmani_012972 [Petrolisthes manimaculis]
MPCHWTVASLRDACIGSVAGWLVGLVSRGAGPGVRAEQRKVVLGWLTAGVRQEVLTKVLRTLNTHMPMDSKWQIIHLVGDSTTQSVDLTQAGLIFVDEVFHLYRSLALALAVNLTRLGISCDMRSRVDRRYIADVNATAYRILGCMKHLTWVTLSGLGDTQIMATLAATCHHLVYLDVSGSPRLTDDGVLVLIDCNPHNLMSLEVDVVVKENIKPSPCCATLNYVCVANTEVGVVGGVLLLRWLPRLISLGGDLGNGLPITEVLTSLQPQDGGIWKCGLVAVWEARVLPRQAALLTSTCPAFHALNTEEGSIPNLALLSPLASLTVDLHHRFCPGLVDALTSHSHTLTRLILTHSFNSPIDLTTLMAMTPHLTHLQATLTLDPWGGGEGEGEVWPSLRWAVVGMTSLKATVALLTHTPALTHLALTLTPDPYSETWEDLDDALISQVTSGGGLQNLSCLVITECAITITGINTLIDACPSLACVAPLLYWPRINRHDIKRLRLQAKQSNWKIEFCLRYDQPLQQV